MKTHFIVTIEGTEVPPGWSEKIEKKLRRDLKLLFGDSVTVRKGNPLPPPKSEFFGITDSRQL